MPAEPFQNRGASKKGQRGRTPCFWSGSVGLPFKRQSLPSSGTDVKLTLWIRPATWISAKDGVQAQTRILFHALRKMNIPTVIFINKIDQAGVDLQSVVQSVRDKLSADIIIKQTVSLSPEIVLEENTDIEAWDAVIENNDELLEKYIAGEPISREKLAREEQQRVQDASLFPVYHGSAKNGLGIQPLMDAVTGLFQPIGEYTAERCACGIRWPWPGEKS